ncbi:MAG TPA: IPT/TIG domain-containing protein, partial [Solirubrobacterales bacterium]|nr:IPT/TIG domain-containing protein [Solirubrobacterales bacterium]
MIPIQRSAEPLLLRIGFGRTGFKRRRSEAGLRAGAVTLALLGAIALLLALGASPAAAVSYVPGTPASLCTGTGVAAGECGEIKGVAVDTSNGNVYAVDTSNLRINQFNSSGAFVRAFGAGVADGATTAAQVCTSTCFLGLSSGTGAIGTAARGIAVDPTTHVVYVVSAAARVAYFDGLAGTYLGQTEGTGSVAPSTDVGAPEKFAATTGIAVDTSTATHYVYMTINVAKSAVNQNQTLINKFQAGPTGLGAGSYLCQITGTAVTTKSETAASATECGGNGVAAHKDGAFEGLQMGSTTAGSFQAGGNLTTDSSGNVFIAESVGNAPPANRHVISQFNSSGDFVRQFLPGGGGISATEPRPEGVAALPNGNLLVSDGNASVGQGGKRVQEFQPSTVPVPPLTATALSEFGLGTITGGSYGVAVDATGANVYVGDRGGKQVWKFSVLPSPSVTGLDPIQGPAAGGNTVKITGTNLTGATKVEFGTTVVNSPFTSN